MKKLFALLLAVFALCMFAIPLFAQGTDPGTGTGDLISQYFYTITGLSGITVIVAAALINATGANGWLKQLISWIVAMGMAWIGYLFNVGMFENITIGWTIVLGLASGITSNGIYDITFVQYILEFLKLKIPTKK